MYTMICNIIFLMPLQGDSGGPLVTEDNTVIGIASAGFDYHTRDQTSALFTRVVVYKDFINDVMGNFRTDLFKSVRRMATYEITSSSSGQVKNIREITIA